MPFDIGPHAKGSGAPEADPDIPIDWIDWGMRIVVFWTVLILLGIWMWSLVRSAIYGFTGH